MQTFIALSFLQRYHPSLWLLLIESKSHSFPLLRLPQLQSSTSRSNSNNSNNHIISSNSHSDNINNNTNSTYNTYNSNSKIVNRAKPRQDSRCLNLSPAQERKNRSPVPHHRLCLPRAILRARCS